MELELVRQFLEWLALLLGVLVAVIGAVLVATGKSKGWGIFMLVVGTVVVAIMALFFVFVPPVGATTLIGPGPASCINRDDRVKSDLIKKVVFGGNKNPAFTYVEGKIIIINGFAKADDVIALEQALTRWGWKKLHGYDPMGSTWEPPDDGWLPCPGPLRLVFQYMGQSWNAWLILLIALLLIIMGIGLRKLFQIRIPVHT